MAATETRLLVLGAVRLFEPVNGYQIRRELMSWEVDEWAHINPGSIYSSLSTLGKQGYVDRHDLVDGTREVAVYTSTEAGRTELPAPPVALLMLRLGAARLQVTPDRLRGDAFASLGAPPEANVADAGFLTSARQKPLDLTAPESGASQSENWWPAFLNRPSENLCKSRNRSAQRAATGHHVLELPQPVSHGDGCS